MRQGDELIPMFIRAKSLNGLRSLMLETNSFYKKNFKYDWQYAKNEYVALYYLDLKDLELLTREEVNKREK